MELRDLNYFQVVAQVGHLGRAAQQLGRTQPALTKCIRRLEEELHAALFERVGRGLKLTPVGEVLLARTLKLRNEMNAAVREVTNLASGEAGHVRIGSGATTTEYLLPGLCQQIWRETPTVTLELVIGMNDVLREALRKGQLDLVIGPLPETENEEFENKTAMEDHVVVAAREGHPIFEEKITMATLLKYRWVLPAKTVATRQWLDRAFQAHGLHRPDVQIESTSISLLPRLIAATGLLSFISRRNLGAGRVGASLREVVLPQTTMARRLGVVYRKGSYLSPAAQRIMTLIGTFAVDAETQQGTSTRRIGTATKPSASRSSRQLEPQR